MTTPYNPDDIMNKAMGQGNNASPQPTQQITNQETRPLGQDDAIILKDTPNEFERTPLPTATYDAEITQADLGFHTDGKAMITFVYKITGPSYVGRLQWYSIKARSYPWMRIILKKILTRSYKANEKGEYISIINYVDTTKDLDEKEFCDKAIAIGAKCKLVIGPGKPYRKTNPDGTIVVQQTNKIKDILPPTDSNKFM